MTYRHLQQGISIRRQWDIRSYHVVIVKDKDLALVGSGVNPDDSVGPPVPRSLVFML
jgi:hypothetical protein